MKAHDVRHLRVCKHCGHLGDGRWMPKVADEPWHDTCVVKTLTTSQILQLPASEREKITIGAAGVDLMRKLMDSRHLELVA
jgi:hypothetical protein